MIHSPPSIIHSPTSVFHLPMSSPDITIAEIEAVPQVLQTPYLSLGPRHAVGVSSGTAGLHLCIIAAGVDKL